MSRAASSCDNPVVVAVRASAGGEPFHTANQPVGLNVGQAHITVGGSQLETHPAFQCERLGNQGPAKQMVTRLNDGNGHTAFYGRFSTSEQKETSLEDQLRRCRDVARRHGTTISDIFVFTDAAISGSEKGRSKRVGFDRLIAAIESGEISLLVVDELCRLARDVYELAKFDKLITRKRVRVITADGLDSTSPSWSIQIAIMGVMAQQSLKETTHRVKRGMQGQLERGFMIAYPPYGYRATQVVGADGKSEGTKWEIHEAEAATVRQIFVSRAHGQSYLQIAKALNSQGIAPAVRKRRREVIPMWMPAAVNRILANPIYKGQFLYRGSLSYLSQKAVAGLEPEESLIYPRSQLRIVTDEQWAICNDRRVSRSGYGGGRQLLAGLVTCGFCQSVLNVSSPSHGTRTLTCGMCNQEKAVGGRTVTPGYVAVNGVAFMLKTLIQANLSPEIQSEFKSRLRDRLSGGQVAELAAAEVALSRADRLCQRLAENMGQIGEDDPYLVPQYRKARQTRLEAEEAVNRLRERSAQIDTKALDAQLGVDPAGIVEMLFSENAVPVERKRAVLARLFPRIVTRGKQEHKGTLFEIDMVPGGVFAELTQTDLLVTDVVRYRVLLKCGKSQPIVWQIEYLPNVQ